MLTAGRGCDIHGTRLGMLDIEELRLREDFLALAQVDISVNDIRDEGLKCLVDALLGLKVQLIVLKAARSNLTARSGEILKQLLLECNDLEEIRVSGNKLGAVGLRALCKGTRDHPNMIALDIRFA
jgi:Ran GTPase-activating protein (RanGAP) involved in mRNA processing and transport